MNEQNKGFSASLLMFILAIIVVAGLGGYVYYNLRDEPKSSVKNADTKTNENNSNTLKDSIPDGFIQFKDDKLGVSFYYPEKWGVSETTDAINDEQRQYVAGNAYNITFKNLNNEYVRAGIKSKDFVFSAQGKILLYAGGFTNYQERYSDLKKENKVYSDNGGSLITYNYYRYGAGLIVNGIASLESPNYPGIEFIYEENIPDSQLPENDDSTDPIVYLDKAKLEDLKKTLDTIK